MVICLKQGADCLHIVQLMPLHPQTPSSLVSFKSRLVFTARCYASAVLAMGLCPSVTSRSSTKMAKPTITQTTPRDSPGTLVFLCQRSPRNSTGSPPTRAPNAGGVVKIGDFRQITGYISKTVHDSHIVSIKVE